MFMIVETKCNDAGKAPDVNKWHKAFFEMKFMIFTIDLMQKIMSYTHEMIRFDSDHETVMHVF